MKHRGAAAAILLCCAGVAGAQFLDGRVGFSQSASAVDLRARKEGFVESVTLHKPPPITTHAGFLQANPQLQEVWPDLAGLLPDATVSSLYERLYSRKVRYLKEGGQLSNHNYLDCATALWVRHPESGRRIFVVQADMDVVTDGSDPVRAGDIAAYDEARGSDWFLPQTAYGWQGEPGTRNPFLDYYPSAVARLDEYRAAFEKEAAGDKGRIWRQLIAAIDTQKARMKTEGLAEETVRGLKNARYLLGTADPFIVLPSDWISGSDGDGVRIGDFAAVIHKGTVYPAILGEAGPTFKAGEASLALARAINPSASGRNRAVSDLGVTYLVFPGTAARRGTPDLVAWEEAVAGLLRDAGVRTDRMHRWSAGP